jgi:hypothetical protein
VLSTAVYQRTESAARLLISNAEPAEYARLLLEFFSS